MDVGHPGVKRLTREDTDTATDTDLDTVAESLRRENTGHGPGSEHIRAATPRKMNACMHGAAYRRGDKSTSEGAPAPPQGSDTRRVRAGWHAGRSAGACSTYAV